jgi:TolB-like protein/DNA-binding winged helix-turn-helix (wHTH) protein/Tfp pilus assembly protein PilF
MSTPTRRLPLAFGAFEIDPDSGQIRKHGLRVRLDDKAFQVLLALVERPGAVVTRDELVRRLWPDNVHVEFDKNLNNAVGRLRDVLGDSAASPRFIETLPRKGYRFIGAIGLPAAAATDVVTLAPEPDVPWRRRIAVLAAIAAASAAAVIYFISTVPVAPLHAIVVLPFDSAGVPRDESTVHVAFGLTDALTAELSRLDGLRVVSLTSARWYKEAGMPLAQIARELDADAVIEGSVFQEGSRLRVTVQLIDAAADTHLWAETYTRESGSLIALQMEIAEAVAREVHLTITPAAQRRLASRPLIDATVHEAYLRGRYYLSLGTEPDRRRARAAFEEALARDVNHALSQAGLADVFVLDDTLPPGVAMPKAKAYARKALELDAQLAAPHATLGYIHYYGDWDWEGARRELRRAIELDPNDARAHRWFARVIGALGQTDEAVEHARRAVQLDPVSADTLDSAAATEFRARRHDQSLALARRILELRQDDARGYEHLATNFALTQSYAECLAAAERGTAISNAPYFLAFEAHCLQRLGRVDEASVRMRRLEAMARETYVPQYFMALAAIGVGRLDDAVAWLERGYTDRDPFLVELKMTPWLDPVRSNARVQRIIRAMNFPS